MDTEGFEKKLKEFVVALQKEKAARKRQQKLEEERKQKEARERVARLKIQIEQEVEKWHDTVTSHLEILGKEYWGSGYSLVSSKELDSECISGLAATAMKTGEVARTWAVQKVFELAPMREKVESFSVTIHIVVNTESDKPKEVYLVVGALDLMVHEHDVTTYEDLVPWLFQAFANGPWSVPYKDCL